MNDLKSTQKCMFCLNTYSTEKVCECFLCKEKSKYEKDENKKYNKLLLCEECYKIHLDYHYKGNHNLPKLQYNDEDMNENSLRYKIELEHLANITKHNNTGIF